LNVPASQLVQDDAPMKLYLPAAQLMQYDVPPVLSRYVPAAHGTQEAGKLAYDPAGQEDAGTHDDAPNALYVPAAQDRHAAEEVLPVLGLYVPCAMARGCGGEW